MEKERISSSSKAKTITLSILNELMTGEVTRQVGVRLNVYQSLLVKQDAVGRSHLPLSGADWYLAS